MYSAEDLFTEDDVEVVQDAEIENDQNLGDAPEENEAQENQDDESKKPVKPKRVVRNPQPKLNVDSLKGPKGLLCLEGYFKNKKYKGRGHEQEDLRTIMKTYEYWCHRLYPKFPFDDCLARIENLGTKKPLQTFLKRIRADLLFEEDKPVRSDNEEQPPVESLNDDPFDNLMSEDVANLNVVPDDRQTFTSEPRNSEDCVLQLTDYQLERIRLNKEKADRLRQERSQRNPVNAGDCVAETSAENKKQLERIQANKEKAERLCRERLQRTNPRAEICRSESDCVDPNDVVENNEKVVEKFIEETPNIGSPGSSIDVNVLAGNCSSFGKEQTIIGSLSIDDNDNDGSNETNSHIPMDCN